jgi:hypothetical protein
VERLEPLVNLLRQAGKWQDLHTIRVYVDSPLDYGYLHQRVDGFTAFLKQ